MTPPAVGESTLHSFEGRLELHDEATNGGAKILKDLYPYDYPPDFFHIPEFDFEFVQEDDHLIPVKREMVLTENLLWNYLIGPGRVWSEEGDQGYSRASFPFTLIAKGSNTCLNGTMTFLFNDSEISQVWYQVTQETETSLKMNMWGLLEATCDREDVADAAEIRDAFAEELATRMPSKPLPALAVDYPGVKSVAFLKAASVKFRTWSWVVANGINYVSKCPTRYGFYSYCESMRAGSDSTA